MDIENDENINKDLWKEYPIKLTEHNDLWNDYYKEEENELSSLLKEFQVVRISHIGSTALKNIKSKNVVDVLVEIGDYEDIDKVAMTLQQSGYVMVAASKDRLALNKGYTLGETLGKVYHVHVRRYGDNNELYFRDYLNTHDDVAMEYEKLKMELVDVYPSDREAYQEFKKDFIKKYTLEGKKTFGNKYN